MMATIAVTCAVGRSTAAAQMQRIASLVLCVIVLAFLGLPVVSAVTALKCGTAAMFDAWNQTNTTLNIVDIATGVVKYYPFPSEYNSPDGTTTQYFVTEIGEFFSFNADSALSINVTTGAITPYPNWKSPLFIHAIAPHYKSIFSISIAGYDSMNNVLYGYNWLQAGNPTLAVYVSNNGQWSNLTTLQVPQFWTGPIFKYEIIAKLTDDATALVFVFFNVKETNESAITVYNITSQRWNSAVSFTTKYPIATPIGATSTEVILWLVIDLAKDQFVYASYSLTTGEVVSSSASGFGCEPYQTDLVPIRSRNQLLQIGYAPTAGVGRGPYTASLYDVKANKIAYTITLPAKPAWTLDVVWTSIGCSFEAIGSIYSFASSLKIPAIKFDAGRLMVTESAANFICSLHHSMEQRKVELLSVSRCFPPCEAALAAQYTVHKLYEVQDRERFLAEVGPRIRAIQATGSSVITASLIDALPALEIIAVFGVGYDSIDLSAAKRRRVRVTNTPNVVDDCVADLAMGLIISAARQLRLSDGWVRGGDWITKGMMPLGKKVSGSRVGIVGLGNIGLVFARRAAGFDMKIAYHNRKKRDDVSYTYYASLKELAHDSDFLVVLTPGGAATRHLINEEVLIALGKKGVLVNVSRGSVVDEEALIRCLRNGTVGGAALDVFENEPRVSEGLVGLPHVVLSSHIGTATTETRTAMGELVVRNLEAHFAGKPLPSPLQL